MAPLGTDWPKEFLEIAPFLIVVFKIDYGIAIQPDGSERRIKHYYDNESVGIAGGYPAPGAKVPAIEKKRYEEIADLSLACPRHA